MYIYTYIHGHKTSVSHMSIFLVSPEKIVIGATYSASVFGCIVRVCITFCGRLSSRSASVLSLCVCFF